MRAFAIRKGLLALVAAAAALPAGALPTLDAGWGHNVAVTASAQAWAWGDNDLGKLGNGSTTSSSIPVRAGELARVVAGAAGANVSVALRAHEEPVA